MKRIVLAYPREFQVTEADIPEPAGEEVLIRIKKVGICGSDIHLYRNGRIGSAVINEPLVLGHECVGEIASVGNPVCEELSGRLVAIEPSISCSHCAWCVAGWPNLCPDNRFLGLPPTHGALQEYITHPSKLVEVLPEHISQESAVLLEPLAIALHAIRLLKIRPGLTIGILGTGVIGTCVLELLRLQGELRIICVDLLPERLRRAQSMGAKMTIQAEEGKPHEVVEAFHEITNGIGADVVFECSGSDDTLWNMCEVAKPGGHLAVIGTNDQDRVSFSSGSARRKGLTLRFIRRSCGTFPECIRLAREGLICIDSLVTHIFPASNVDKAFETVNQYQDGVLKALVDLEKW